LQIVRNNQARGLVVRGAATTVSVVTEARLAPGDPAPDFTLADADGQPVSLSDFHGMRTIVYFYPAAMTPGCTTEACDFRDSLSSLQAAGVNVLGISPDAPSQLAKFRERDGLTFPLLADQDRSVMTAYGAYGEKKLYGKTVIGVIRSTFVVGADGKVEKAMYNVKATGHVSQLRRELGIL
jgi:thioredoxin-dependent peroxiredoxin